MGSRGEVRAPGCHCVGRSLTSLGEACAPQGGREAGASQTAGGTVWTCPDSAHPAQRGSVRTGGDGGP